MKVKKIKRSFETAKIKEKDTHFLKVCVGYYYAMVCY